MMETATVYPPHLKKVLRSYQASATTSLHGPDSLAAAAAVAACFSDVSPGKDPSGAAAKKASVPQSGTDYDPFLVPPPFPIQQPPIFTPPDQTRCERSETILEGETISCFVVGGEKRLCLPQILNTVLRDFSLQQINGVCDDLHIFCSRCNPEQLDVLKVTGILPLTAPSCGLITKTDAERLCSALLHGNPPKAEHLLLPHDKRPFQFKVYHECFGKCMGYCLPDLYTSPFARCLECSECHGMFAPHKFVCHAHREQENRTCHWGFDSANWRAYMLLCTDQADSERLQQHLDQLKSKFDYTHKYKRKQKIEEFDPSKRFCVEDAYSYPYPAIPWDPAFAYWYHSSSQWSRMSAFKPWTPVVTKSGKTSLPPFPPSVPVNTKERCEQHCLQNPSVTNSTGAVQSYKRPSTGGRGVGTQKKENSDGCVDHSIDSDDIFSDSSLSTLSAGSDTGEDEPEESTFGTKELKELRLLLKEEGVEEGLCAKVVSEVEGIILKCRQAVQVAVQSRISLQKEMDQLRSAKRDKIRKLQEAKRILRKELEQARCQQQQPIVTGESSGSVNAEVNVQQELVGSTAVVASSSTGSVTPQNNRGCDSPSTTRSLDSYSLLTKENESLQTQLQVLQKELDKMKGNLVPKLVSSPDTTPEAHSHGPPTPDTSISSDDTEQAMDPQEELPAGADVK